MVTKKRDLEIILQTIPCFPNPKIELEQYPTSAEIAADVLWNAYSLGDIKDFKIADLGTGTGIFAIGAALLGAKEVIGVDLDSDAIKIARQEASDKDLEEYTKFVTSNVSDFHEKADTVIQNPPFGAQKIHQKEIDRIFMSKSLEIAPVVYSFHLIETQEFVRKFFQSLGGSITHIFYYKFPLLHTFNFHQKEKQIIDVIVLRVERSEFNK